MAGPANQAAQQLANMLSKVARYSVLLGIGGTVVQSTLYTGECECEGCCCIARLSP